MAKQRKRLLIVEMCIRDSKHPVASAGLKMGVSAVSGFVVAYVVLKLILG